MQREFRRILIVKLGQDMNKKLGNISIPIIGFDNIKEIFSNNHKEINDLVFNNLPIRYKQFEKSNETNYRIVIPVMIEGVQTYFSGEAAHYDEYFKWIWYSDAYGQEYYDSIWEYE